LIGKIDFLLVDIAPAPAFRRIVPFDDRVPGRMEMCGRVAKGRIIAAPHVPAGPAQPQVHPRAVQREALFATASAGRDFADRGAVWA